jgi:hypothetical protein
MRLDDGWQKLGNGSPTGGDDRAGLRCFHRPSQRKKTGAALLKMPPNPDKPGRLRTSERLEQSCIPRTSADHKLADARFETTFYHFQSRGPCIHKRCANPANPDCPSTRFTRLWNLTSNREIYGSMG